MCSEPISLPGLYISCIPQLGLPGKPTRTYLRPRSRRPPVELSAALCPTVAYSITVMEYAMERREGSPQRKLDLAGLAPVLDDLVEQVAQRTAEIVLARLGSAGALPEETASDSRLLTVEEAAEHLSLSPSTVYRLGETAQLARVKLGSRVRFRRRDLDEYAERHRTSDGKVIDLARTVRAERQR
jgi:excisionase family DNA binding protein